jgi:hypothetical protein
MIRWMDAAEWWVPNVRWTEKETCDLLNFLFCSVVPCDCCILDFYFQSLPWNMIRQRDACDRWVPDVGTYRIFAKKYHQVHLCAPAYSGCWYVQNVSTFPNTFAVVSPLICVFWIQLTRTNAIFSRIALVSCVCAEIRLSGKIFQKSYFTRRHTEPEYETERGQEGTTPPSGAGQARPRLGVVWSPQPSPRAPLLPTYTLWPENIGVLAFFPDRIPLRRHHQKPRFRTRNFVLACCRDRDLEDIIAIIITDPSPLTIHDSPIHVWVIPAVGEGDGRDWMRSFIQLLWDC